MDPCIIPGVSDLHDYIAVPGKIIPIPGTDYVVITPDTSNNIVAAPDSTEPQLVVHNEGEQEESAVIAAATESAREAWWPFADGALFLTVGGFFALNWPHRCLIVLKIII